MWDYLNENIHLGLTLLLYLHISCTPLKYLPPASTRNTASKPVLSRTWGYEKNAADDCAHMEIVISICQTNQSIQMNSGISSPCDASVCLHAWNVRRVFSIVYMLSACVAYYCTLMPIRFDSTKSNIFCQCFIITAVHLHTTFDLYIMCLFT